MVEFKKLRRGRGRAADTIAHPIKSQLPFEMVEHQKVKRPVGQGPENPLAGIFLRAHVSQTDPHRQAIKSPFDKGRIRHPDFDHGHEFFPDSGNTGKNGGRHFPQIQGQRVHAFNKINGSAAMNRLEYGQEIFINMGQRQIRQQFIIRPEGNRLGKGFRKPQNIVVADHRPFGPTGGPRGVDHHGGVPGINGIQAFSDTGGGILEVGVALLEEFVVKHDTLMGKAPETFGIPDDHLF